MEHAIQRRSQRLVPVGVLGDARLAGLAARGDEAAFAAIFRRYHQPLYRYCRAITGNSEDAADALQNTMVKAMRALPGEERAIELKPWLFRVAHNEAVSLLRRRRPHARLEEAHDTAVDGPEIGAPAREELRELMADLRELPARQQGVLILRELNGLSHAEIGAVFGTTSSAAKRAAYEGRIALQEMAKGRAMDCEAVTRAISDGERQFVRGRRLRAHLRSCADCASFKQAIEARRASFGAIAPALPATAAVALLQKLLGGGGGPAGGGGLLGFSAAGGKLVAGAGATKGAAAIAAAVAVGTGVGAGGARIATEDPGTPPAAQARAGEIDRRARAADAGGIRAPTARSESAAAPATGDSAERTRRRAAGREPARKRSHRPEAGRSVARRSVKQRRRAVSRKRPTAKRVKRNATVKRIAPARPPVARPKPTVPAPAKPAPAEPTIEPTAPVAPQLKNGSYPKRTLAPGAPG